MTPRAIHQFSLAVHAGDGIANGMFLTQRLLRAAGFASEIYCLSADPPVKKRVRQFKRYAPHPEQLLLIHHGIGNSAEAQLQALPDKRFLVFHNITPAEFFAASDPIRPALAQGWQQLDAWRDWLTGAIADSEQNLSLLLQHGYAPERCAAIPLLVDLSKCVQLRPEHAVRPLGAPFRLLFVGRIMPHKNQLGLVEMLAQLRTMSQTPVHLSLVGGMTDTNYVEQIRACISALGLAEHISLPGKVADAELARYFQQADLYLSLSRHEGFGMPLIEAMARRLPVLAYAAPASNIPHTIGAAGLLLDSDDPAAAAAAVAELIDNPRVRAHLNQAAVAHLTAYRPQALYDRLRDYLLRFDLHLPHASVEDNPAADGSDPVAAPLRYRLEGPCETSYSLAIVNRHLAFALARRHPGRVGLYPSEGPGDYPVDPKQVAAHPGLAELLDAGRNQLLADCALRLMYPPRASGMKGLINGLGPYGWEESQLPWENVLEFNRHCQFVTTMSDYVSRTLIDNGVSLPVRTIGIGVDHVLAAAPDPSQLPEIPPGFCLLHVSSAFPRKGIDVLLAACAEAFTAADPIVLVIKTFPNPHHDIERQLGDWRREHPRAPKVVLINRDLSDGAIRALYQRADLLVAPSRGEGFGLPMAEAMLHNLPVVTTGFGGQTDFCDDTTAWLIDYRFARARTHMGQGASVWAEPDSGHLAKILSELFSQHQAGTLGVYTSARVQAAHARISADYSWDAVAARLDDWLAAWFQAQSPSGQVPMLQPSLRLGCVTTWHSACGIATYSEKLLTPALSDTFILANTDAKLTQPDTETTGRPGHPRVERCWRAGQKDTLQQLEQAIVAAGLEQVVIQFNFSFFNLKHLRRLLQALHAHGVQTFVVFHSTADVYWGSELKTLRSLLPELGRCQRLFVHGTADLNHLRDLGLDAITTLLPHGVATDLTPATGLDTSALPAGRRIIASYGFLLPHKGVRELISAFAQVRQHHPDTHLLLLNALYPAPVSNAERDACSERITALGLSEHVTLINNYLPDSHSLAWLARADCIVYPYQHTQESSSAAVRWGLASRKPVLCTPLDIFEDVASAVHFLPGTSVEQLAQGLNAWLADPHAGERLADAQAQWLHQHDWRRISQLLRGLLTATLLNNPNANASANPSPQSGARS
ncbi:MULTISPECIES: glycosyltransferase family 4 protein [Thiorhodovibrio]|uniref:glycosyltransferase family 4 protein n=1 Tax=Thiorhodovibrio TaxID=61593 RepID=UPI0019119E3B|nr:MULTISPECIES: glycosyltransferase [Thiorhodovibrio]MBK5969021.1 hypothetical protein [Thiorhodovibrio winogradskyi]WPL15098.1 D-inositol 3-phosphate glycosyltransferase [Thiorhodovibrio litoralis]